MRTHRTPSPLFDLAQPGALTGAGPATLRPALRPPHSSAVLTTLITLFSLLGVSLLGAQSRPGWAFRSSASADLWFHSVAMTGFDAFGAVSLYQPGYATQVRAARDGAGQGPTPLERNAESFNAAFSADRNFEVLHFIPMYFAAADVDQMLDALAAVASNGESGVAASPAPARFGAAVVASVLTTPEERATLARFTTAVRDEWTSAYRAERAARAVERDAALTAAARTWTDRSGPALAAALVEHSLDGGLVLASPALGPEGRLFAGRPDDRTDNVIAVRLALEPSFAGDPAWLAVREMFFPSARAALTEAGALPAGAEAAELATGRAAARLGAAQLADHADLLAAYQGALLRVIGRPVPEPGAARTAAFEAAYPLTDPADVALRAGGH